VTLMEHGDDILKTNPRMELSYVSPFVQDADHSHRTLFAEMLKRARP
jgi:hypothetical protein